MQEPGHPNVARTHRCTTIAFGCSPAAADGERYRASMITATAASRGREREIWNSLVAQLALARARELAQNLTVNYLHFRQFSAVFLRQSDKLRGVLMVSFCNRFRVLLFVKASPAPWRMHFFLRINDLLVFNSATPLLSAFTDFVLVGGSSCCSAA